MVLLAGWEGECKNDKPKGGEIQLKRVSCTLVALPVCLRTANEAVEQDNIVFDVIRRCTRREKLRSLFIQFLVMFSVVIYVLCFSG
jgi:hypothetical protein